MYYENFLFQMFMQKNMRNCLLLLFVYLLLNIDGSTSSEISVPMEYSFGDSQYTPFGSIHLKTIFDGSYKAEFKPFSPDSFSNLKSSIAAHPTESSYRIRSNGLVSTNSVDGFIRSKFLHLIELSIDQSSQKVLSITHFPVLPTVNTSILAGTESPVFVRVKTVTEFTGPDTVSYLQRMEEERRARQQGATQDNRSFLQKYWIYFVPVVLFVVLSNAFNPEGQAE